MALVAASVSRSVLASDLTRQESGFKVGPFSVSPASSFRAGGDSNVYNQETDKASDSTATFTPSLGLAAKLGSYLRLGGRGGLDLVYYSKQARARSVDRFGQLEGVLTVGRFTLSGNTRAAKVRDRLAFESNQPFDHQDTGSTGQMVVQVTRRVGLKATITAGEFRYEEGILVDGKQLRDVLNRRNRTEGFEGRVALSGRTQFVASADLISDRFLRAAGSPDATSRRYLAGLEFGRKALLQGRVAFGVRSFPSTGTQIVPPFQGLAYQAAVRVPGPAASLSLVAERDAHFASTVPGSAEDQSRNLYVRSGYSAEIAFALPASIVGRVSTGLQHAQYVQPFPIGATVLAPRIDSNWVFGGSATRHISRSAQVAGSLEWTQRHSQVPGYSFSAFRFGLTAAYRR